MRRPRGRSIRSTLVGLLAVPLVSLVALWGFAARDAVSDVVQKRNLDNVNRSYADAAGRLSEGVGQERQVTVSWLAARGRMPRTTMDGVRRKTDAAVEHTLRTMRSKSFPEHLDAPLKQRLDLLVGRLDGVRRGVDSGATGKLAAFTVYNDIMDANAQFYYQLVADIRDTTLYQQIHCLIGFGRIQELVAREAALLSGGKMTGAEQTAFTAAVNEQRYVRKEALAQALPRIGVPFEQVFNSPAYLELRALEDRIIADRTGTTRPQVDPAAWQPAVRSFLGAMNGAESRSRPMLAKESRASANETLLRLALVGGLGLLAVLLSAVLMLRFGRRISRDLVGLQDVANDLAHRRLPDVVTRLRRGDDVDVTEEAQPLTVGRTAEVSNVAAAFSTVQRTAIEAAVGQAELRKAVNQVFRNLARRNQSLLHRQLAMLDTLERKASEPEALEDLFRIDHLTTRMRRHAEGLIILSGASPGRGWRHPVRVLDVLRGSIGEVEDYTRVDLVSTAEEAIVGTAVADVIHLIAELVENAVNFSPPAAKVEVDAGPVGNGFVVEIQDRGLGMSPERLAVINDQLRRPPEFDLSDGDRLGLFVVGSLAHRHGIEIALERNAYGGLKAIVLLPHSIVVAPDPDADVRYERHAPAGVRTGMDDAEAWDAADPAPGSALGSAPASAPAPASGAAPGFGPPGLREAGAPGTVAAMKFTDTAETADLADPVATADPADTAETAEAVDTVATTHAGMPRRVRRASLAPELRGRPAPPPGDRTSPEIRRTAGAGRSPERARSVMSSMQSGWQRGRTERIRPADESNVEGGER